MKLDLQSRGAKVEFKNVGKQFGAVSAVSDCTFDIRAGEFFTLLGPSGSGKTTLLNMVAGFLDPSMGGIFIDGVCVTSIPTEKRNVGMVFQNYSLFPHMNVARNVAFPLKMRGVGAIETRKRVQYALSLVDLSEYENRMPSELSGGERQQVAFARAIVFEPRVLLMDEPLGALDLKLRERMQLEIKRYREQIGCTVIYVTHDQAEALTLSDRIMIMNHGRPVQIGSPEQIYDRPASRFAAEFIGDTNFFTLLKQESGNFSGWCIPDIEADYPGNVCELPTEGRTVLLSVRPEKILRHYDRTASSGSVVEFTAMITETVFLGDIHRYTARCTSGKLVTFKEHRSSSTSGLTPGETVALAFYANAAVPLLGH